MRKGFTTWIIGAFIMSSALCGPSALNAGTQQTRYDISGKESKFTYSMTHRMHAWNGVSTAASGRVSVSPDARSVGIRVSIPVLSFDSHNRNRDSHMGEVVESYIFPNVSFESTAFHVDSLGTDGGRTGCKGVLTGNLTFHGVTHPIECPISATFTDSTLYAHGAFGIKITDFEMKRPSFLLMKVKDWIQIVFDIKAYNREETVRPLSDR